MAGLRVLFVCLGNICRSPLAEGILRKKALHKNFPLHVESAGTAHYHVGESPDNRTIMNARLHEVDLTKKRARHFTPYDFERFDLIYAMDNENLKKIISLAQNEMDKRKTSLILEVPYPGSNLSVPDPYYGGEQGFETVFNLLDHACDCLLEQMLQRRENPSSSIKG